MALNDPVRNTPAGDIPSNAPPPFGTLGSASGRTQTVKDAASLSLWDRAKQLFGGPARQAAIASTFYGLGGIAEFAEMNEMMGTPEYTVHDAAFIGVLVGVPTALMLWRRGYVSAGVLGGVALMNAVGAITEVQAGNPYYNEGSVIYNLVFLGIFARAAWVLWKTRKVKT